MTSSHSQTEGEALPIGQAANRLGVSVVTLRRWADKGKVQSFRTMGGQRRFATEELDRVRTEARSAQ